MVIDGLDTEDYRHIGATVGAYLGAVVVGGHMTGWGVSETLLSLGIASALVLMYLTVVFVRHDFRPS